MGTSSPHSGTSRGSRPTLRTPSAGAPPASPRPQPEVCAPPYILSPAHDSADIRVRVYFRISSREIVRLNRSGDTNGRTAHLHRSRRLRWHDGWPGEDGSTGIPRTCLPASVRGSAVVLSRSGMHREPGAGPTLVQS